MGGTASSLPRETHSGNLKLGDELQLPCGVLEDGRAFISTTGVSTAFGQRQQEAFRVGEAGHSKLPRFLARKSLNPFIPADFADTLKLIVYLPKQGGKVGYGYPATIIPAICRILINAKMAGALRSSQDGLIREAIRLLNGLGDIGIIALVHEATGYLPQPTAYEDTLRKKLKKDEAERICALPSCSKPFIPNRSDQIYHHENCRTAAWRRRKNPAPHADRQELVAEQVASLVVTKLDARLSLFQQQHAHLGQRIDAIEEKRLQDVQAWQGFERRQDERIGLVFQRIGTLEDQIVLEQKRAADFEERLMLQVNRQHADHAQQLDTIRAKHETLHDIVWSGGKSESTEVPAPPPPAIQIASPPTSGAGQPTEVNNAPAIPGQLLTDIRNFLGGHPKHGRRGPGPFALAYVALLSCGGKGTIRQIHAAYPRRTEEEEHGEGYVLFLLSVLQQVDWVVRKGHRGRFLYHAIDRSVRSQSADPSIRGASA